MSAVTLTRAVARTSAVTLTRAVDGDSRRLYYDSKELWNWESWGTHNSAEIVTPMFRIF